VSARPGALARWWTFTAERYEPWRHVFAGVAFALGNAGVALAGSPSRPEASRLAAACLLVVVFFFRLRVYDEIKDHATDLRESPGRPLARGLVSVSEARRVAWVAIAMEGGTIAAVAAAAASAWAVALLYSLAMYREFGVGSWLRPRMELYAISHTLVASTLGVTVACLVLDAPPWGLPSRVLPFMVTNWSLFNVFEFSRKTFAAEEERAGVASYSSRWGPRGAVAITLGWVVVGLGSAALTGVPVLPGMSLEAGLFLVGLLGLSLAAPYAVRPLPAPARSFRASMSSWATALYLLVGLTNLGV
jgi:4-hydroxybenzoate polyprenyltransferase